MAENKLRSRAVLIVFLLVCSVVMLVRRPPAQTVNDPLSGVWTGDWGTTPSHRNPVTVNLRWDGATLTGAVNPGPNALQFTKTSFDVRNSAVHLEIEAVLGGREVHYVIDGMVEDGTLIGTWYNDPNKGNFRLIRSKRSALTLLQAAIHYCPSSLRRKRETGRLEKAAG